MEKVTITKYKSLDDQYYDTEIECTEADRYFIENQAYKEKITAIQARYDSDPMIRVSHSGAAAILKILEDKERMEDIIKAIILINIKYDNDTKRE